MCYFKQLLLPLFILLLLTIGCKKEETATNLAIDAQIDELLNLASNNQGRDYFTLPESDDYEKIPNDTKNPITKEKVELGKLLYHETGLAINPKNPISKNTYSCASCHFASAGFQAGRFQGIAEGGIGFGVNGEGRMRGSLYHGDSLDVQPIRSPTTLHVAYQEVMLWNGQFGATGLNANTDEAWVYGTPIETNFLGFEGTETQAIAGLKVHRMGMDNDFLTTFGYKALFDAAFPDVSQEERYNITQAGLAIAAYERTLLANQSPFQKWLKGDINAMTQTEKEGALLFFGKAECVSCHTGPALNKMDFSAIGMMDLVQVSHESFKVRMTDKERKGRAGFTGNEDDMYKFKIPQLYNLKDSPFYGHGSSLYSIRDVVAYKNAGIKENSAVPDDRLDPDFKPLGLTEGEILLISVCPKTPLK